MRRLQVALSFDPENPRPLGTLAIDRGRILFEFAPAFLTDPLPVSPFRLAAAPGILDSGEREFEGLPGLFHDIMPDGWGRLVQDRAFQRQGLAVHEILPMDRLAAVGHAGIGALIFDPVIVLEQKVKSTGGGEQIEETWRWRPELAAIADHAARLYEDSAETVLPALLAGGGSPGGARPKVLASVRFSENAAPSVVAGGYPELSGQALDVPDGYEPWIIKFPSREDGPDAGPVESAYAAMARAAGIAMPPTFLFPVADGRRFFGVRRFDRVGTGFHQRLHVHTMGGLLHADYRVPCCDYREYLTLTLSLTHSVGEAEEALRRMAFNVLAHNRDDHVRNFAFVMDADGTWRLSPAYDLTFSTGMNGEHATAVRGEGARPTFAAMQQLAQEADIPAAHARALLEQVDAAVADWPRAATNADVSGQRIANIERTLRRVRRNAGALR